MLPGLVPFVVALVISCSGSGPTGVIGFDVGGAWIEVSTLALDECGTSIPTTSTTDVTIIYGGGTQITFVFHFAQGDLALPGTFNTETHAFVLPYADSDPQTGNTVVGAQSGTFTSESNYTSTTEVVLTVDGESCTVRSNEVAQRV